MLHSKDFSSLASPTPSVGEVWLMIASPIGVSPVAARVVGWNKSAVVKSAIVLTGPKPTMPISTRLAAMLSLITSFLKATKPAFNSSMGLPCIEPEVSSSRRHGQRGSGLSANCAESKGICSKSDI